MIYDALDIAKYIITYCNKNNHPISNLKLQKMIYYTWIDYYNATGSPLFTNEICAWKLGPVVPDIYYEFCSYAGSAIARNFSVTLSQEDSSVIDPILNKYILVAASDLVNKTHKKDGPWDTVYKDGMGNRSVIPFSLIRSKECTNNAP